MDEKEGETERNEDSERLKAARKRAREDENGARHDEGDRPGGFLERDEASFPVARERLVRLPIDEEKPEQDVDREERGGEPDQGGPLPRRSDRRGKRPGKADCSDESRGVGKEDRERREESESRDPARRRFRQAPLRRGDEEQREKRIRAIRFRPHGVVRQGGVQGEEDRRENAAAQAAREAPDEPGSERNESE